MSDDSESTNRHANIRIRSYKLLRGCVAYCFDHGCSLWLSTNALCRYSAVQSSFRQNTKNPVKSKFTVDMKSRTFWTLSATLLVSMALPVLLPVDDILILSKLIVEDEGCKKMFSWRLVVLSLFESDSMELSYNPSSRMSENMQYFLINFGKVTDVTYHYRCCRPKCTRRCGVVLRCVFQTPHDFINKHTTMDGYETSRSLDLTHEGKEATENSGQRHA